MSKPATAFCGVYSDWKLIRTRSCVQVIFEIPLEQHDAAYQALGGMPDPAAERWFGIARLVDGVIASAPREAERGLLDGDLPASRPRRPVAPEKQLAQQAGICCSDPAFRRFLTSYAGVAIPTKEAAAELVRELCCVDTRANILPGTESAVAWHNIYARFLAWRDHDFEVPRQDHQREQVG